MKIRIKFGKKGYMKFIGHLDVMRFFQKAIRRAKIDISYTEGFSPHQKMSFAAPLGVGLQSTGEYLDIEVNSTMSGDESVKLLNEQMVEGIEILSYRKLPDDAGNAMSIVAAADYLVTFKEEVPFSGIDMDVIKKETKEFFNKAEIKIVKKTKKSEVETDIKPMIYSMEAVSNPVLIDEEDKSTFGIKMQLATGSVNNLKPELVIEALYDSVGKPMPEYSINIYRLEVYADKGEDGRRELVALEDLAEAIN